MEELHLHQTYIKKCAKSATVVLFIHGILGTPNYFKDFLPLVPVEWSIYNILLDGHGQDVQTFAHTSMEKWKKQVRTMMKEFNKEYENIIIVAHSMGTLLAIEEALVWKAKVKMLFLMGVPLSIFVKPAAVLHSLKIIFGKVSPNDMVTLAAENAYSITPDPKIWKYVGWVPRYVELFKEIRGIRRKMVHLQVPCYAFQSQKDELVAVSSGGYLKKNPNIQTFWLQQSGHFYYEKNDRQFLLHFFQDVCERWKE